MPARPSDSSCAIRVVMRAPIAALRCVVRIAKPSHQFGPCECRALGIPACCGGLVRKAETRQRWDDNMEGVFSIAAVTGGIRKGTDHLSEFEDRTRPAVAEQDRQGVPTLGAHVEEGMPKRSISVRYWSRPLSIVSQRRQSYFVRQ